MKNTWNEGGPGWWSGFCFLSHQPLALFSTWLFHAQCSKSFKLCTGPSTLFLISWPSNAVVSNLVHCDIFISIPKLIDIPKCDWDIPYSGKFLRDPRDLETWGPEAVVPERSEGTTKGLKVSKLYRSCWSKRLTYLECATNAGTTMQLFKPDEDRTP